MCKIIREERVKVAKDFIREKAETDFDVVVDTMPNAPASTIEELEQIVAQIINTLDKMDRYKLRQEMSEMNVELHQNPTTKDLNEGLAKAQAYKDRLAEIYTSALREFKIRERCVEMLLDAYNVVSKGSSADKRKGEATMKYPMLLIQLEGAETFLKEVDHILNNVKSSMEALSRQVTLMQIQLQLGEIRRGEKPSSFNSESEEVSKGPKELNW